jgi:hypothetical protein
LKRFLTNTDRASSLTQVVTTLPFLFAAGYSLGYSRRMRSRKLHNVVEEGVHSTAPTGQ